MIFRALMLSCLMVAPAAAQVQVVPQSNPDAKRIEMYFALVERADIRSVLTSGAFLSIKAAQAVGAIVEARLGTHVLPAGAKIHLLYGPALGSEHPIPYRISVFYAGGDGKVRNQVTVARGDDGHYVEGVSAFPEIGPASPSEKTRREVFDYSVLLQP